MEVVAAAAVAAVAAVAALTVVNLDICHVSAPRVVFATSSRRSDTLPMIALAVVAAAAAAVTTIASSLVIASKGYS